MPAPSTPEARNLHRKAQALIEQATVQQAESSASRIRQQGNARDDGGAQGPEASVHTGGAAGQPANQGGCRSGSGSLTRAGRPRTLTLAMSSTPDGRATQRHERRQATTHGGVGATTAWGAAKALFCRNIIDVCEAREHGGDSKLKHQVEGAIMQAKEWTRKFGRCTRSRSNKVH
jgi:hypothetical protein